GVSLETCFAQSFGPTPSEAQRALADRIAQQSEGKIILRAFKKEVALEGIMREDGSFQTSRDACTVMFEAQVEVVEPCRWATRFEGKPLAFKTLKADQPEPKDFRDVIE